MDKNQSATGKRSFVMYHDQKPIFDNMSDEDAGKLIKSLFEYSEGNEPVLDGLMKALFSSFKSTLDRDAEKYNSVCKRNMANGKKGGRPKNPEKPTGLIWEPTKPDSDSDSDSDKEKEEP